MNPPSDPRPTIVVDGQAVDTIFEWGLWVLFAAFVLLFIAYAAQQLFRADDYRYGSAWRWSWPTRSVPPVAPPAAVVPSDLALLDAWLAMPAEDRVWFWRSLLPGLDLLQVARRESQAVAAELEQARAAKETAKREWFPAKSVEAQTALDLANRTYREAAARLLPRAAMLDEVHTMTLTTPKETQS